MWIIQCAEDCKFQKEGYCSLDRCSTVNPENKGCPYKVSPNNSNSIFETSDTDKL